MHWVMWIILANVSIMLLEYIYRIGKYDTFWCALPWIIVPILFGQAGLFYGFKYGTSLFMVGAVFTLINAGLRILNSFLLGEVPNAYNWLGIALLVASVFLLKVK